MIITFKQIWAIAPVDPPNSVYAVYTMPDFVYNTHINRRSLGVVMRYECEAMQRQLVGHGAKVADIQWSASTSFPEEI